MYLSSSFGKLEGGFWGHLSYSKREITFTSEWNTFVQECSLICTKTVVSYTGLHVVIISHNIESFYVMGRQARGNFSSGQLHFMNSNLFRFPCLWLRAIILSSLNSMLYWLFCLVKDILCICLCLENIPSFEPPFEVYVYHCLSRKFGAFVMLYLHRTCSIQFFTF